MTTLIPEAPGHWTEAVLLAFPSAVLTHDEPTAGPPHVTLMLADDLEIHFREETVRVSRLAPLTKIYSATLQDYDLDTLTMLSEEVLFEDVDIDAVIDCTKDWVEAYENDLTELDALESLADLGWNVG